MFPAIALVLLVRWRVGRDRFGAVLLGLMALSLGITLFGGYSHDRIYFGTETRAFELLAGGLLAVVIYRRRVIDALKRKPVGPAVSAAGVVAAVVCVVMWATVPQTTGWLYRGGLAAYALLTCAVIVAAIHVRGPILRVLSTAGLRRVGELSYALYVFHWPIFLWLDGAADRAGHLAAVRPACRGDVRPRRAVSAVARGSGAPSAARPQRPRPAPRSWPDWPWPCWSARGR